MTLERETVTDSMKWKAAVWKLRNMGYYINDTVNGDLCVDDYLVNIINDLKEDAEESVYESATMATKAHTRLEKFEKHANIIRTSAVKIITRFMRYAFNIIRDKDAKEEYFEYYAMVKKEQDEKEKIMTNLQRVMEQIKSRDGSINFSQTELLEKGRDAYDLWFSSCEEEAWECYYCDDPLTEEDKYHLAAPYYNNFYYNNPSYDFYNENDENDQEEMAYQEEREREYEEMLERQNCMRENDYW